MMDSDFKKILAEYGISLGYETDTDWEWFRRETGEYENCFPTESEAYRAAVILLNKEGEDLPEPDEDGDLPQNALAVLLAKKERADLAGESNKVVPGKRRKL